MSLRPESSGMVSGAHSWQPWKSCTLSASFAEPTDKLVRGSTSLLLLVPWKDSTCSWGVWPHLPGPLSGAAWGLSFPVLQTVPGFLIWCLALFYKLLPTQKIRKQLEVVGQACLIDDAVKRRSGRRAQLWRACMPCLVCSRSTAWYGWCAIQQLGFFFLSPFKKLFSILAL